MKKFYSFAAVAVLSLFSANQILADDASGITVPDPTFPSDCKSVSPENGAVVEELSQFSFTYKDNFGSTTLETIVVDQSKNFTIDGVSYAKGTYSYSQSGFTTTITLKDAILTPGLHEINIPRGFFMLDGDYVNQMGYGRTPIGQIKWYVIVEEGEGGEGDEGGEGGDTPENPDPETPDVPAADIPSYFEVTPAQGAEIEALSQLQIDYITTSTAKEFYGFASIYDFYINDTAYSTRTAVANCETKYTENELGYIITLNEPITTPGVYTISFEKGYFEYNEVELDALSWSVIIKDKSSGVDTIVSEDAVTEIYTIEGLKVKEMQPGKIYIVRKGDKITKCISK